MRRINHSSRFIEMQKTSDCQNELGDFIERCIPERCGDRELPVLSVTKEYAMVHQSERFEATIVSRDKSNYIVAPRGYLVQGIHIDESNFGIQNLVDEGIVSPAYKLWRFKNQDSIPELIEYYLRSEMAIKYFKRHFLGSTVPRRQVIKKDDFLSMPINLPGKSIQESYFAFFKQADKSKFSVFKSRFIEMFGNPVDSQEMGTLCVGDLCSVISGFPFKSELFNDNKVGKPLIRIRDVVRGYTETYTTEESDSQFIVKTGDLLVGMDGNFEISVWKSEEALLNQRVCMIAPKDERITRNYIIYAVQPALTAIEEKTNATTVKHISASQISSIRLPRVEEVRVAEFDNVVHQADKSKYLN